MDDGDMARELTDGRLVFLSTLPAGRGERRLALTGVLVSPAIFLSAGPFAKIPLAQLWAFIPIYESALVINDLITAGLLFGPVPLLPSPGPSGPGRRPPFPPPPTRAPPRPL